LDTNLRLQLSPEEEDVLFQKYDLKHDGTICYREFCDVINRSKSFMLLIQCYSYLSEYPETTITPHPESFTNTAPPYLNSWRSTRHVGTQDESERLQNVLQRIATFSKQRGVDILTTMEQYDRDKYSDPGKPGLINYLNFVQDLTAYSHANETTVPATNNNNFEQIPFVGVEEKVNFVLFISVNNFLLFIA
jgi:hypothetical protein